MSTIVATNIQATNTQTDTIKHSGGNTAMTIASSGVVTPKTTSFVSAYAQGSSGYTNISANNYLPFNAIYESAGTGASDFDTSTYLYTAPVNGLYHMSVKSITSGVTDTKNWQLRVDTTIQWQAFWSHETRTWGATLIKKLNAGDTIGVYSVSASYYYRNAASLPSQDHYTTVQYMLLQEL